MPRVGSPVQRLGDDLSRLIDRDLNVEMNDEVGGLGLSASAIDSLFARDGWRQIGGAVESTVQSTYRRQTVQNDREGRRRTSA